MNLMNVFQVLGGLAIFIFGMKLMSDGLHRVAGERMRSILRMFSANRFVAVATGAVVTGVIQSSGASTVMVVGFVNAGLLSLFQAIGLILGSHIGTTVTAQLVAFDLNWLIMPSIIIGLIFSFVPNRKVSNWSETLLGLGFVFLGMLTMSNELRALANYPQFVQTLQAVDCRPVNGMIPILPMLGALVIGAFATIAMQSSSACTGVLVALGAANLIDIHTALVMIMGANIGTTVTAQLAAITANRIAKQAALANTLANTIGALVIMASLWITVDGVPVFLKLVEFLSFGAGIPRQIANAHTIFNVCTTIMWLPFIGLLAAMCERLIPVKESAKVVYERLEPHLLNTPSIALTQTASALRKMLKKAWKMIDCALSVYNRNDEHNQEMEKQLDQREADIDRRQKAITEYLSELMQRPLSSKESGQIPLLLHCTNDVERIGDHASIIHHAVLSLKDGNLRFSPDAETEYDQLHDTLGELAQATIRMLEAPTAENRVAAARLQERMQMMLDQSETKHFSRVSNGECKPQVGLLFLELVEEMRKISRHLENIHDRAEMFYGKFPKDRRIYRQNGKDRPEDGAENRNGQAAAEIRGS
ncbi:MAG: Na/Pi cotransporter family protein [Lentisphaeria bacterium]|nr:Na/Pi cotransporter family protein [Lentisphaeria bacterium]